MKLLFSLLLILLNSTLAEARAPVRKPAPRIVQKPPAAPANPAPEIVLLPLEIYDLAKAPLKSENHTKLPQIDILQAIFLHFEEDARLTQQKGRIVITGENFSQAYGLAKRLIEDKKEGLTSVLESALPAAEIQYLNYKAITLRSAEKKFRLEIDLVQPYSQELPFTFGATIDLEDRLHGVLRRSDDGNVVEVVFDRTGMITFIPPRIAFFIPQILVKIASTVETTGGTFGYVIGTSKKAGSRYMAVRYNLTTCAKSSIKAYELTPLHYKNKLWRVDDYRFVQ